MDGQWLHSSMSRPTYPRSQVVSLCVNGMSRSSTLPSLARLQSHWKEHPLRNGHVRRYAFTFTHSRVIALSNVYFACSSPPQPHPHPTKTSSKLPEDPDPQCLHPSLVSPHSPSKRSRVAGSLQPCHSRYVRTVILHSLVVPKPAMGDDV